MSEVSSKVLPGDLLVKICIIEPLASSLCWDVCFFGAARRQGLHVEQVLHHRVPHRSTHLARALLALLRREAREVWTSAWARPEKQRTRVPAISHFGWLKPREGFLLNPIGGQIIRQMIGAISFPLTSHLLPPVAQLLAAPSAKPQPVIWPFST